MPSSVSLKMLLETGVHFGHRTQKWDPKMKPYIFTQKNGIHIIDLQQTLRNLNAAYDLVRDKSAAGGTVLFVGTKRQAAETIAAESTRARMPYVNTRWLGGTLTNWTTIRSRIETLNKLEQRREKGEFSLLTKKEALILERKIERLQERLGGIRIMRKLPDLLVVIDTFRETTAIKEANTLGIPVLGIVDTNSNPELVDYVIPANDDAMRAIKLLVTTLADAVIDGRNMRKDEAEAEKYEDIPQPTFAEDDGDDTKYLGDSTLAKLKDFEFEDDQ